MKKALTAVVFAISSLAPLSGLAYDLYVIAPDVDSRIVNEELRFCEKSNLSGLICRQNGSVADWWHPETYVQAKTGTKNFRITEVKPTSNGHGLIIYFEPQRRLVLN